MELYVAKVVWYCDGEDGPQTDHLVIAGECFADVMEQLQGYYHSENIDNVHIELINPERPLVRLPNEETYEVIKERGEI